MDTSQRKGLPGLSYPEEYLRRLAAELSVKFTGTFNLETVERYVLESYTALLRTATVKAHLTTRVTHFATDRLTALAQAKGALAHEVPEVLFVFGVDLSTAFPKPLTDDVVQAADVVVTMGCGDACPVHPGTRYQDWELDDPQGLPLEEVRRVRDEIRAHVETLLASLLQVPTA